MKLVFKFILIFAVQAAAVHSERVILIGSHLIPTDSSYKTFLSTNNLGRGSSVDVSLLASNSPTNKNVPVSGAGTFNEVQFERVPQSSDYELKVAPKSSNKCSSAKLIKSSDLPIIFIQYAKPFYKSDDDFSFRIFALNQKMLPYSGKQPISVKLVDAKDKVVKNYNNIQLSNFGIYEGTYQLSDVKNFGKWKIQVESADRTITKKFNVEEPSKDLLEIYIEMSPMVAYSDRKAFMNIYVKDKMNKFFSGTANIYVTGKLKGSSRIDFPRKHVKTVELAGRKNGVGISYDDEIGISPPSDMNLNFDVEVFDPATQRFIDASKAVELKSDSRNTIHPIRKKYFKPGFKFPMRVKVKNLDGTPDQSLNKLKMTVEYHNKGRGIDKKEFQLNLKNGDISAPLNPTADTTQITVNFEFAGAKLTEVIKPLPSMGANEYMQVTATKKSTTIGDKVKYQAQTTGEMESLHVLLIGINGIVHHEEFPAAEGKDIFDFSIELTEEMKPESRGIVFYVRPSDGILVYDEFVLSLTFGIENLLEISAPETGKPGKEIDIDVKTLKGAKVFLTASDQISPLLARDNEISRTDVYNELTYYLNHRFPNTSLYSFERFNGFILQPLTEGQTCGQESARYSNSELDEDDETPEDVKYFPNIWFDKTFDATSDSPTPVTAKLPNSLTTWRYYGISVHPTKGFTVAKVQPKTAVKNEISAQIKAPISAAKSEIVWVDVNAYNTLQDNLRSEVFVSIENGFIANPKENKEFNLKCVKYEPKNLKEVRLSPTLQSQKKTEVTKIPIMPNGNGDVRVKVTAVAGSYNDEASRKIIIQQPQDHVHTNNNFETKVNIQALQNNQAKIVVEGKVLRRGITSSSIIVVDVELPRGYKYTGHDQNDKIEDVEVSSDSNVVTFYLKNLGTNQSFRQTVKVSKVYDYDNHRQSTVLVYDYNQQDEKDVTYYSYDKNTEECDRIEVIRWTNKAKDAQKTTQEAQRTVQETSNKVAKAQKALEDAQRKLKQAEDNVKTAQEKAIEADRKSEDAFNVAEDAWRAADAAKQKKPRPQNVPASSNSIEEPAVETPTNAAEAQRIAKEAQRLADKAQDEASEAEDDVTRAHDDVNSAKEDVDKALEELTKAQKEASKSQDEATKLQEDAKNANKNAVDTQRKVKTAQNNVNDVQKAVNDAADKVNEIKHGIDDALVTVNDAVDKANKATKFTDIQQDILNAEKASKEAQNLAQNANQVEAGIIPKTQQPIITVNQEIDSVQKLLAYCNSIFDRATATNGNANNAKRIIVVSIGNYENGQNQLVNANRLYAEAQNKFKLANDRAQKLRDFALAKSQEARRFADLENTTQRATTARYTPRPTAPTRTYPSWGQPATTQRATTQRTTTQSTRDEEVYYPPQSGNREVQTGSNTQSCSKWYRFCTFGF